MHLVKNESKTIERSELSLAVKKLTKYLYLVEPILEFGVYVNGTILYRELCTLSFHTKTCSEIKT
jgi:hypothetical protein